MMNKLDFYKAWVEALESGEYEQGIAVLRNMDNEYCCLGVACDLAMRSHLSDGEWVKGRYGRQGEVWGVLEPDSNISYTGLDCQLREFTSLDSQGGLRGATYSDVKRFLTKHGLAGEIDWTFTNNVQFTRGVAYLTMLNDHGASFKTIALVIREFLIKPLEEQNAE